MASSASGISLHLAPVVGCGRLPLAAAPALVFFASCLPAQDSVEGFPDLEQTNFSYVDQATRDRYNDSELQTSVRPFRIFDNVYYVGIEWATSFLIDTGDGLILIDSLFGPYIETGVENIRELGFDPEDVEYVIGTHGHFDHMGGHAYYQANFGSRVGLTAADWKRAETDRDQPLFGVEMADVDWVITDGETLELGDQSMTFFITPGHTEGVLSMEFTVRDGDDQYRAVIFGGGGASPDDYWRNQSMLGNIRRFQLLADRSPPFRVRFAGHTTGGGAAPGAPFFERRDALLSRGPGDSHPFVDPPNAFRESLDQAERNAERAILR
ncbi:MAG TPA: MBL fold metallo-hydrolase [Gammaproteobacteria bacterium]